MEDLKNVYIPEKLYVTLKEETEYDSSVKTRVFNCFLGFMSPYAKDKAFEKRQETQLSWAYVNHIEQDGIIYERKQQELHEIPKHLAPRILDNIVQEGYTIGDSIKKTYWGGGNVTWRIKDPRGYELEISSSNLSKILECSSIKNNLIESPCIWVRLGSQNLLVPTNSNLYQNIKNNISEHNKKLSLKDVNVGNIVKLYNNSEEYIYYGLMNIVANYGRTVYINDDRIDSTNRWSRNNYHHTNHLCVSQSKRYVFINIKTKELKTLGTPKIVSIINADIMDKQRALNVINNDHKLRYSNRIAFVSDKVVDTSKVSMSFVEWNDDEGTVFTEYGEINDTINKRIYKMFMEEHSTEKIIGYASRWIRNTAYSYSHNAQETLDYVTYNDYEGDVSKYFKLVLTYDNKKLLQDLTF